MMTHKLDVPLIALDPVHEPCEELAEPLFEPGGMVDVALREFGARLVEVEYIEEDPVVIPVIVR
jgi:hypothetical protein